jgi:hypothetical protein
LAIILTRLLGVILAALAVQPVADGIKALIWARGPAILQRAITFALTCLTLS